VLAANSPLPLDAIVAVVGLDTLALSDMLVWLIDRSLVTPTVSGWYRILDPVVDTVVREVGPCTRSEFSAVSNALGVFLESASSETSLLELARVRYRALLQSGHDAEQRHAFALAADWVSSAASLYHRREYEDAERVARAALEARPDHTEVRSFLVRSLVKQGKHATAKLEIAEIRKLGAAEDAAFLEGFLARHQGHLKDAVEAYESSRRMGRRGVALDRELAHCYLELGEVQLAKERVEAARSRQAENAFLIDMGIRIACYEGNETEARDLLRALGDVDEPAFHYFRTSRVELYFGEPSEVLSAARRAVESSNGKPSFEIQAQLVLALAIMDDLTGGQAALADLKRMYPHRGQDVQRGLECRMQIVSGRFDDALATWEHLDVKSRPVHLRLRRDAMQGLLDHTSLAPDRRRRLQSEIGELDERLATVGIGAARDLVGGLPTE
jgi:tetratricopeptide (TPR) repeat protein